MEVKEVKKKTKLKDEFQETKTNMKMSWQFLKRKKSKMIITIILSLLTSGISIIIPILSAQLLLNLTNELYLELIYVAIFIFIVEMGRNIIHFIFNKITDFYILDVIMDVQMDMAKETLKIEMSEIDKSTSGTFIDRINNDTNDIVNIFDDLARRIIDFLTNIGIVVAIILISPIMFIYFAITSIVIAYLNKIRREKRHKYHKRFREIGEKRTGLISELIRGMKDVRLLDAEEGMLKKTKQRLVSVTKERREMYKVNYKYTMISSCIRDFFDVIFYILGTVLVMNNHLTAPNFLILHMYRGRLENLLTFYDQIAELLKDYNLSATRVFEVLGNHYKKEQDGTTIMETIKGHIVFKNVSFAYDKDEVLKNVNFEIKPGERCGFVGTSGSGKSTIFNLLTRLYNVENGEILIDDVNINEIKRQSLRKNISLIPQNPYIFNFSIRDNLMIGNSNAMENDLIKALKKVQLYDRVKDLEEGLDTEVGEGGITLSGGERQRLAIARNLLKGSNILLFDEATSALDNITQDKVQESIYGLDKNKTILIIAHRLSTIINCDKIVVLDDGKVIDVGPHEELLNRCTKYQELYKHEEKKELEVELAK